MPTPKTVRFHFARISKAHDRLSEYLIQAHNAGVIKYDQSKYTTEGPCNTNGETWSRIIKTTEAQLAQAMREEIYREGTK